MIAQELRIGNWVNASKANGLGAVSVVDMMPTGINEVPRGEPCWYFRQLSGIPITEEILLKCGAKKSNSGNGYYLGDWYEVYLNGVLNDHVAHYTITREIKYLHQLQNLYFALTGQELQISL